MLHIKTTTIRKRWVLRVMGDQANLARIYMNDSRDNAKRRLVGINEIGKRVGESHHRAKLTDEDVELIHALREAGLTQQAIAGKFDVAPGGISRSTVRDVLSGRIRAQHPVVHKPAGTRRSPKGA